MPASTEYCSNLCYDLTATVADGGTDSGAVDLGGVSLAGVFLPSTLEGTSLSFKACDTLGGTYLVVGDGAGNTLSKTVAASRYIPLDPATFAGIRFLKLTLATQTGSCVITLATRPV